VLVTWPSNGSAASYLPDREDARQGAALFADVFVKLHDHVRAMQLRAENTNDPEKLCRAKISVIAHSMGNYVLQKALAITSKRLNNPTFITLIHQLIMVSADVDNDLFQRDQPEASDGNLMANLCYRITTPYSGLDTVLGASAGLKHFGTRRLGRSGLRDASAVHDNVWDVDVSERIKGVGNPHSALFDTPGGIAFIKQVLRGVDRKHIV
jgi:esterase/lipase superfamily enzyme